MISGGQDITAQEDGFVTLYAANHGHIDYLDQLAKNWAFLLCDPLIRRFCESLRAGPT